MKYLCVTSEQVSFYQKSLFYLLASLPVCLPACWLAGLLVCSFACSLGTDSSEWDRSLCWLHVFSKVEVVFWLRSTLFGLVHCYLPAPAVFYSGFSSCFYQLDVLPARAAFFPAGFAYQLEQLPYQLHAARTQEAVSPAGLPTNSNNEMNELNAKWKRWMEIAKCEKGTRNTYKI